MPTQILEYEGKFDSSHRIVGHKGKCKNLHGHTWNVYVCIEIARELEEIRNSMILDFGDIKEIIEELDHKNLNEIFEEDVNPTAEFISFYIAEKINSMLKSNELTAETVMVRVHEGGKASITTVVKPIN